jgi:pyruvate dehydrogenase E1 component
MYSDDESVFYYITLLNENYAHPPMPKGVEEGICKGMYLLQKGARGKAKSAPPRVQLLGSGSILREIIAGAELLKEDFGVESDVWSTTSFTQLRREGMATERWNRLHPSEKPKKSYVEQCLEGQDGPVIASTDYMRAVADQIRPFVPGRYLTLGTDGFGRSDTRQQLRRFFEVDRYQVVVAALKALADDGEVPAAKVGEAIQKYDIDPEAPDPWTV